MGMFDQAYPLSEPTYEDWSRLSHEEKVARDAIMATYAAMIDRVDQNIGRLLAKLEELGELDNTMVLFMSDNGAQAQASGSWCRTMASRGSSIMFPTDQTESDNVIDEYPEVARELIREWEAWITSKKGQS